ncbi:hypothetical protein N431DRAFT_471380 [Stipitochalara longipes BDJ]|nr:hypothetical protein N431DRAFT_471380 [Stipitochalara longipes BDJ]
MSTTRLLSNKTFKMGEAKSAMIALLFLAVVEFALSNAQDVPWAQITAAPGTAAQYLDRRDYSYDTANSHLYGYTSVGMDGTRTQWSAKSCDDIAPTMVIETFQNTVFGGCWAVSTADVLGLYATTASADFITGCSGQIAIGTSTTWDCATQGNCVFNTIYPDLASTSLTLAAICANATAGNTYIHALTTSAATPATAPTSPVTPASPSRTSGAGSHGLSKGDVIALAVGLGVGIPTLIVMICAWLCPCTPWTNFNRRRRAYGP